MLVLDLHRDRYFNLMARVTDDGLEGGVAILRKLIEDIISDRLDMHVLVEKSFFGKLYDKLFILYYPWSLFCLIPFVLFAVSFYFIRIPGKEKNKKD